MTYDSRVDSLSHIRRVNELLLNLSKELIDRAVAHDASKLESPEIEVLDECVPKLAGLSFGSPAYKDVTAEMKPMIEHHKKVNRHHPEFFLNGIEGMGLIDLMEMLVDWKAAGERSPEGNLVRSILICRDKYKIDNQLTRCLLNTAFASGLADVDSCGLKVGDCVSYHARATFISNHESQRVKDIQADVSGRIKLIILSSFDPYQSVAYRHEDWSITKPV